ncbi:hypothetical protein E3N88_17137 [Mikania micrantha]|uniref:Uncharacterized protein n=1 Tax=Mikania micrantha TaxID=192012 RepID=A0A5N6NR42_9ASTR|nr:hypothetical protein E3N88_17137 [Mikania micrantha]
MQDFVAARNYARMSKRAPFDEIVRNTIMILLQNIIIAGARTNNIRCPLLSLAAAASATMAISQAMASGGVNAPNAATKPPLIPTPTITPLARISLIWLTAGYLM